MLFFSNVLFTCWCPSLCHVWVWVFSLNLFLIGGFFLIGGSLFVGCGVGSELTACGIWASGKLFADSCLCFLFAFSKVCSLLCWVFLCACRRSAIGVFSSFVRDVACFSLCLGNYRCLFSASCFTQFSVFCIYCSASDRCGRLCLSNAWSASARCDPYCLSVSYTHLTLPTN